MKLGVDLSIWDELEPLGAKLYYQGRDVDPFAFFGDHSHVDMVRLRLWHHPYDEAGNPFGGGTNDFPCLLRLAKRAKEHDMGVLVDFHYSDFYVDPSRQRLPKAWEGLSYRQVLQTLYEYTRDTLLALKEEGVVVPAVQVGNEITHGMLFPFGELDREYDPDRGGGFPGLAAIINSGAKAVREVYPEAKVIAHLEHSGDFDTQDWFFSHLIEEGADFDVIGESYYPYWHGSLAAFEDNITRMKAKYGKEMWVVEMGYEYAQSRVEGHHNELTDLSDPQFQEGNIKGRIPFPLTKLGQAEYLKTFLALCKRLDVGAVCYWEPTWVLVEGNGWAKEAGEVYCGLTPYPADNDWANETLFDFDGNANVGVEVFTADFVAFL